MKINLEIGVLITLISISAFLGGFYYTTQIRLENLEEKVSKLEKKKIKPRHKKRKDPR